MHYVSFSRSCWKLSPATVFATFTASNALTHGNEIFLDILLVNNAIVPSSKYRAKTFAMRPFCCTPCQSSRQPDR